MQNLAEIGAAVRAARKRVGLTAQQAAQRAHINRNTLSALENGRGNVELNTLLAICEVVGLELALVPTALAPLVSEDNATRQTALQESLGGLLSATRGGRAP